MIAQPSPDTSLLLLNCDTIPYSEEQFYIIDTITYEGNKITKDHIITRELLFRNGDTICARYYNYYIKKSRENLINTSLFNFVFVDTSKFENNHIDINIRFIERWYVWPFPIFELADRNFNSWLEKRDWNRVSYGILVVWENFRGRKENLEFTLRFGYDQLYRLFYSKPYIDKKERLGFGFGGGLALNKEVAYQTRENKQDFYRDENNYVREEGFAYVEFTYRKVFYNSHRFYLGFNYNNFSDSVLSRNPTYLTGDNRDVSYFTLSYLFKSDHRDYRSYPLSGYYFDLELAQKGLGVVANNDVSVFSIQSTFRKYWELNRRFYYAFGLNSKFSSATQPYFLKRGLGYERNFVRGYELYVIDGNNFGLFKNNIKFAIIPTRVANIGFLPTEKFSKIHYALYMNLFTDVGFVYNEKSDPALNNELENKILIGYGVGLDFVTYYDVVIRLEFSINRENETGFFLHFVAPI